MFPYDQFPEQVSSIQTEEIASSYRNTNGTSGFFEGLILFSFRINNSLSLTNGYLAPLFNISQIDWI